VASPSPIDKPGEGQGLMKPSVNGTLNVLNAAANSTVKRVIVNSSAFTMFGSFPQNKTYNENDWAEVF
jgi:nucleoside-diphosphate-sugar epimerase